MRDSRWVDWGVNGRGRRIVVLGEQGKWLGVLGPEMRIVEMSCESGGWAKVARLESGVRGTMVSCQLGRETRGNHTV